MQVSLVSVTQPRVEGVETAEELIALQIADIMVDEFPTVFAAFSGKDDV